MKTQNLSDVAFCLAQGLLADNILAATEDPNVDTQGTNASFKSAIEMLNTALLAIEEVESLSPSRETVRRIEILELIQGSLSEDMSHKELRDYLTILRSDCEGIVQNGQVSIAGYHRLQDFFTKISNFTTKEHQRLCPA